MPKTIPALQKKTYSLREAQSLMENYIELSAECLRKNLQAEWKRQSKITKEIAYA